MCFNESKVLYFRKTKILLFTLTGTLCSICTTAYSIKKKKYFHFTEKNSGNSQAVLTQGLRQYSVECVVTKLRDLK